MSDQDEAKTILPLTGTMGAGPTLPEKSIDAVTSAMVLMVIAMMFIPLMDVFSKILSTRYAVSPVMITFVRFAGQAILLFIVILAVQGPRSLTGKHNKINLLRGMLMGAAVSNFFIAIKYLPLADAIAIFFVEPLIVLLLSSVFLGEKIGLRRGGAAVFGFCGALVIIQPTYEIFGAKALLPLVTACLFSIYLILSRKFGKADHPFTMQFWAGLGGVIMC
ncbi:MAG: DMT family transporter, partial [Salaquimonas sp.]